MKRIIYILMLINAFAFNLEVRAEGNWQYLNPNTTISNLNKVKIDKNNNIFAIGDYGTIISSTNFGQSWTNLKHSRTNKFSNILNFDMFDNGLGFYLENNQTLKYDFYNQILDFEGFEFQNKIKDILIHTNTIVFFIGENNDIYRSYDGGTNWIEYKNIFNDPTVIINKIKFFDQKNGVILTNKNIILQTTNAGISWTKNENLNNSDNFLYNLKDICFINNEEWFLFGDSGLIIKTSDLGNNFEFVQTNSNSIYDIIINVNNVLDEDGIMNYFILTKNKLIHTKDFSNYKLILESNDNEFNDICIKENLGVIVGNNGSIYTSTNYCLNWENQTKFSTFNIETAYSKFINQQVGFIFELNGNKILKTTNRGLTWNNYIQYENKTILNVHFFTPKTCITFLGNGEILVSKDSCKSFNGIGFNFRGKFKALNENIAILYNIDYQYWTFDGGNSWKKDSVYIVNENINTKIYNKLYNFEFWLDSYWEMKVNQGSTYMDNLYYVSVDSGKTWKRAMQTYLDNYYSLRYKVDDSLIYFTYYPSFIEIRNGIQNYRKYVNANKDMIFLDKDNGYAIGSNFIYNTTNRGITWNKEFSPSHSDNYNLHSFDDGEILIISKDCIVLTKNKKINTSVTKDNIENNSDSNFLIFPNPSSDKILVDLGESVVGADLSIYDILGNEIMSIPNYTNKSEIDISTIPIGTYTIQIQTPTGSVSQRLLVNR